MWNKRREEETKPSTQPGASAVAPSAPAPIVPKPIEVKKESTPVASNPVGRIEPESRA